MNKQLIESIVAQKPELPAEPYSEAIVDILTAPKWYHPVKRLKFSRTFPLRVRVVMTEYVKELLDAIATENQTIVPTTGAGVQLVRPAQGQEYVAQPSQPPTETDYPQVGHVHSGTNYKI